MPRFRAHELPEHMQDQIAKQMTAAAEKPPTPAQDELAGAQRKAERERLELEFKMQLHAMHIHGWEREYQFDESRKWRADFAFLDCKVLVEVEGGIWRSGGGAHSRPGAIERDVEKYNAALLQGWVVFRVIPKTIDDGSAVSDLVDLIKLRGGVKPRPQYIQQCKDCHRDIIWLKTIRNGKSIPVDAEGVEPGIVFFNPNNHTAHMRTCPERNQ